MTYGCISEIMTILMFLFPFQVWDHANTHALQLAKEKEGSIVVHPFDHPDIW